jgi:peptidoglycan hydrolase-like protein with peptidoglycan-binding domain
MKSPQMLMKAGTLSILVLIGGCAAWGTGVVAPSRANGEATAPNTRLRSSAPVEANVVVAAQMALSRYGYDPGPADGTFNESTKEAVLQFQQARGIRATGELDSPTVAALGLER